MAEHDRKCARDRRLNGILSSAHTVQTMCGWTFPFYDESMNIFEAALCVSVRTPYIVGMTLRMFEKCSLKQVAAVELTH